MGETETFKVVLSQTEEKSMKFDQTPIEEMAREFRLGLGRAVDAMLEEMFSTDDSKADAVFAGAELPDGNTAVFGSSSYQSESYNPDSNHLKIKLDVVFGGVKVRRE